MSDYPRDGRKRSSRPQIFLPREDYDRQPPIMGYSPQCEHRGELVRVGPYEIGAGGNRSLQPEDLDRFDVLVPLEATGLPLPVPQNRGFREFTLLWHPLPDMRGVPEDWSAFVKLVIEKLRAGDRVLTWCIGSHGRTGTMLASLVALLESRRQTPDPITAVRDRHCLSAVETRSQAEAVFALRGELPPSKYRHLR